MVTKRTAARRKRLPTPARGRVAKSKGRVAKLARKVPGVPFGSDAAAGMFWAGGASGNRTVTETDTLSLSAIFAAVDLCGRVIGTLPLHVYEALPGGGRRPALDHPAYQLLHTRANPWMSAVVFRRVMEVMRRLFRFALAEIVWDVGGRPRELWPLPPWLWAPDTDESGDLVFKNRSTGEVLAARDVLYVPNFTFDGVTGMSFVDFAAKSLGLQLDAQDFAAAFFANGAVPGGMLLHEGNPGDQQRAEVRKGFEDQHKGAKKANRLGVLWGGWKFQRDAGAVEPEKAQLLGLQVLGIQEAARWIGMPPHLLRNLSRATFSNIEESNIEAVVYSWSPACIDHEQEYDYKLLDAPRIFCKHNLGGLMRGNTTARTAFYKELFGIGGISVNRICELEDENPVGPMGDLRFVPLNMQTLEQAWKASQEPPKPAIAAEPAEDDEEPEVPDEGPVDEKQRALARGWLAEVLDRFRGKELNAVRRRLAAGQPGLIAWAQEFYPHHQALLTAALRPVAEACGVAAETIAAAEVERSTRELTEIAAREPAGEESLALDVLLETWKQTRTADVLRGLLGE